MVFNHRQISSPRERMGCNSTKDLNPNAARGYLLENFSRHKGGINCMSVNEDKTMLMTGGEDYTLKLWKADPVAYLGTLDGHTGYITCCTFHGQYAFSGSADKTIRKWNVKSRQCVFIYEGHEMSVTRILCTPCEVLISTSLDSTARAWDALADSGTVIKKACLQIFKSHLKSIFSVIFIPAEENPLMGKIIYDGDTIITGSTDCTARSWSLKTGEKLKIFGNNQKVRHKGPINCMAVDGEAKKLFTGSVDSVIKCWNIETAECLREMKGHKAAVMHLLVHNRILYSAGVDKIAMAWIIEIGEISKIYHGNAETISCLKYLNGFVYTACTSVRMYKAKTKECKRVFKGHNKTITAMEVTEDKLFTASSDGTLRIWDTTGILDEDITYEEQLAAVESRDTGMQPLQKPTNDNDSRLEDFA